MWRGVALFGWECDAGAGAGGAVKVVWTMGWAAVCWWWPGGGHGEAKQCIDGAQDNGPARGFLHFSY